jgi:hypothetical protein
VADREEALAAWQAAGTDIILLPSGVEARLDIPTLGRMLARGILPGHLRALALKVNSPEGVKLASLSEDETRDWDELEQLMIADCVIAIRPPGFKKLTPFRLSPEDVAADPPKLPRVDLEALRNIVLRIRTPKQIDALSRLAFGQMTREDATLIVDKEQVNTIVAWATFRDERRRAGMRAQRKSVGKPAVDPAGDNRAARRLRRRRGAGAATDEPAAAAAVG